ncbi:hypothetical protein GCM10009789_83020 [Kribbella sancticallisti]|uniref:Uncharacterized protein n=1 Tax=Kribbella sancticallisti TaxID=460087 RepID=A0ABN2ESY9_9ACTN
MITRRAHARRTGASRRLPSNCPSCGWQADSAEDKKLLQDELLTEWWALGQVEPATMTTEQKYCGQCRPSTVYLVACGICRDGPLLAGELAAVAIASEPDLPVVVAEALTDRGWRQLADVRGKGPGWVCCR